MNESDQTLLVDQVLARLVDLVARSVGLDQADLSDTEVARFSRCDILGGTPKLCGRTVDSLAIAELLVDVDKQLEVSILDWIDEHLDSVRPTDIARTLVTQASADRVEEWISGRSPHHP